MRSRLSCALLLLLISFATTDSAHAEDADQLHADPTSVALEVNKASPLAVTNESGSPAVITGVALQGEKPTDFAVFPVGGQPAFGSVVGLTPNQTLGPLETVSVQAQMKEAASAELVIAVKPVSQQTPGQVLTIALGEAPKGKWGAPANGEWASTAWRHPDSDADLKIPLSATCTGQPAPVTAVLGSGSKQVTAKATCKKGDDFAQLALTPSADPGITYKGTLHLLGDDKDGDVAITLRGKDRPWLPILVIVAGVVLGLVIKRDKGVKQKLLPLTIQINRLAARPGLQLSPGGRSLVNGDARLVELRSRLSVIAQGHLLDVEDGDRELKELTDRIDALSKELDDFDAMEAAWAHLESRLDDLGTEAPIPAFVAVARNAAPRGALSTDEVTAATKRASGTVELIDDYRQWKAELATLKTRLGQRRKPEARTKLHQAEEELPTLSGPDDPRVEKFPQVLADIADLIGDAGSKAAPRAALAPGGPDVPDESAPHVGAGGGAKPLSATWAVAKAWAAARTWLRGKLHVSWVALLGGALVALWTALQTLYIGKDFGTLTDYLGAFVWGAATPVALDTLAAGLNRLRAAAA